MKFLFSLFQKTSFFKPGQVLIIASLAFLIYAPNIKAQISNSFIKHLSKEGLQREHLTYLLQAGLATHNTDSLHYFKAKYYLQYFNDSLFLDHYLKSKPLFIKDSCAFTSANIRYLTAPAASRNLWFNSYSLNDATYSDNSIHAIYKAGSNPINIDIETLPIRLQPDFINYQKYYARSPVIAGALSAVIPGLGKLYAGKKNSFYTILLSQLIYGVQSYEAIHKLGIKNPYSIFSVSVLGIFYAANVYGSYFDLKQVKHDTKNQFLINASNYYSTSCDCPLY